MQNDKEDRIVKCIWCDNTGENKSFQHDTKEEGCGLQFNFTACKTPQQNGCIEWKKFTMHVGCVQVKLNNVKLVENYQNLKNGLWVKCAATAMKIENLMTKKDKPMAFSMQYMHLERLASLTMQKQSEAN